MYQGVLKELREKVTSMEERRRKHVPDHICDDEAVDPMDEMDVAGESQVENRLPKRIKNKPKSVFPQEIAQIKMWEWPPEACIFGNRQRLIDVFLEGQGKLWLYKEYLDWLIKSLWVQQQVKGVADVARWRCRQP